MIDVWQYYEYAFDFEYASVLNMLGSHIIVNKILHNSIMNYEYTLSSKYASVTQGSIEDDPSYYSGSQCARAWIT